MPSSCLCPGPVASWQRRPNSYFQNGNIKIEFVNLIVIALALHKWKTHRHIHVYSCTNIPHLVFFPPVSLNGKVARFPDAENLRNSLGLCGPLFFCLQSGFCCEYSLQSVLIAEIKSPFPGSRNLSLLPSSSPLSTYPQPEQGPSWSSQKHLEANSFPGGCSQVGYTNEHMASHPAVTMVSIKRKIKKKKSFSD